MNTDTQVRQDVISALQWEPTVDSTHLNVTVENGIVTLRGFVGSYIEKWDAGRTTQGVPGVRGLSSEIAVTLSEANNRNDTDIARAVVNVLKWMSYLPKNCIKVDVDKAWITLSGEVEWEFQRQAVLGTVRFLIGVKGVIDHIVVKTVGAAAQARQRQNGEITTMVNQHASGHADAFEPVGIGAPGMALLHPAEAGSLHINSKTQDAEPALELDQHVFYGPPVGQPLSLGA